MRIVLAEPLGISPETLEALSAPLREQGHRFISYPTVWQSEAELLDRCQGADILMIANHPLPAAALSVCHNLRFVSVAFVGYDHVDLQACRSAGVQISNTAGYCDDAVAELAVGLAIASLRRIPECDTAVLAGKGKGDLAGHELAGRTVGIIGTGSIGMRTAQLFSAFRCPLLGWSRSNRPEAEALGIRYLPLPELLSKSDIVTLHVPLTENTRGLIGRAELEQMREGALLINTARGPVVDAHALSEALHARRIYAAIDVYDADPPLSQGHPLRDAPNLIRTPHVGFDTRESIDRRAAMAFENVSSFLAGSALRRVL